MSRKRLDGRGGLAAAAAAAAVGLLAESHTPISADPLDAVFEVTGELGRTRQKVSRTEQEVLRFETLTRLHPRLLLSSSSSKGQVCGGQALRGESHGKSLCRQVPAQKEAGPRLPGRGGPRDGRAGVGPQQPQGGQPACGLRDGPRHRPGAGIRGGRRDLRAVRVRRAAARGRRHASDPADVGGRRRAPPQQPGALGPQASEHPPDQPGAARRHQNCRLWPGTQIGRRRGAPRDSWHTRVCGARNPELRAHHNVGRSLERGRHRLHAGDGRVSVRRRRQAGDLPQRVPGQRGLRPRRLLESLRARRGLHPQAAGQSARGPSQRGRVHRPPVAVAASAVVRRAGARPRRPRAQLRCQVGGAPARGQGELPAAAAAAFPRQTLPLGRGGASRRR
ncbi:serine/threonine-protein kinase 17B isoform X1 [Vanacampus margaritifer]